ncbi:hypothetical protein DB347_20015 [Opitutaceae bacterium EW11]|nr:hypothetical protein DB347_20015 [Opitutaceae bacterium EW11]
MPPSKERVTLRTIGETAGVSAMTVSLALRNHPRIPEATRRSIQQTAEKLGYRPDPQLAKLMHHLRVGRQPGFQASVAAITTVAEGDETSYVRSIIASAKARAGELGYGFTLFRADDPPHRQPALQRILRSRGVDGVLLLPVAAPRDVSPLLDWNDFSVVATTYGVLAPQFHRVVPHQFGNALEICRQLGKLGYRRIGLVLPAQQDVRVHHGFSAAVAWQSMLGGTEFVRPLIHQGPLPAKKELKDWFQNERPDAIISSGDVTTRPIVDLLGLRVPGPIGVVSATKSERSLFAGIDERPDSIGAAAIEQLAAMIQRGEKGTPALPKTTMIDGRWIDGKSVRRSQAADKPAAAISRAT